MVKLAIIFVTTLASPLGAIQSKVYGLITEGHWSVSFDPVLFILESECGKDL